jgi:hypothetical protein
MLTVLGSPRVCCDGLTRRETLRAGALSLLGGFFNLPSLPASETSGEARGGPGRARSVLLIYLQGGPATQDMFDLKPHAPDGIRSEFKPIATSASGVQICEHLPKTARWMHRTALVRSTYHQGICHSNLPMYTGYDLVRDQERRATDPPSMGSVCAYHEQEVLRKRPGLLPSYVYLPCPLGWGEVTVKGGPWAGFLGQRYDPLCTECTAYLDRPQKSGPSDDMQRVRGDVLFRGTDLPAGVTVDRLNSRRSLLEQVEDQLRGLDRQPALQGHARKQQLAYDLITSAPVREAFDLDREPDRVRGRYGRSLFGNALLLGRRLVERGVRFVNVSWDNMRERFSPPASNQVWDTHERNFPILKDNHLPHLDQTFAALMEDLDHRGLLDETLIVMMGEMGRTPRINANGGRDHWTSCYTVLLAGAGIRGGSVYGASDAHAAFVKDRPAHVRDVCATIYYCLRIDPGMPVLDHGRRPVPVAHGGQPLNDILA